MKTLKIVVPFIFFTACTESQSPANDFRQTASTDTIIKHDTIFYNANDWQQDFGLTHDPEVDSIWGKPVKFYIDNPKCSPIAIDFYRGHIRPTDNQTTAALLALVTTNNNQLRPFYRWCLEKTIQIQDGALGESTGIPARQYAEKYPKEFFEYIDSDTTTEKYDHWVSSISYSGYYDQDDHTKPAEIRKRMSNTMKRNCENCEENIIKRINKLAGDCFP